MAVFVGGVEQAASGGVTIATGTFTGDGATSQAITGLGFQPKAIWIYKRFTVDNTAFAAFEFVFSSTEIEADNAAGGVASSDGSTLRFKTDKVIALGADGFTVDDGGADADPNADTIVYNYIAIG